MRDFIKQIEDRIKMKTITDFYNSIPPYVLKIVKFEDKTHKNPKFRHWLTFKTSDGSCCFVSTFTTSPKVLLIHRDDDIFLNSVVDIQYNEFNPPFTEVTYLDCNLKDTVNRKTFGELCNVINWEKGKGFKPLLIDIPQNLINKIIIAIVNSEFTTPSIKTGFKESYSFLFNKTINQLSN